VAEVVVVVVGRVEEVTVVVQTFASWLCGFGDGC
jgi:hypothetical protein